MSDTTALTVDCSTGAHTQTPITAAQVTALQSAASAAAQTYTSLTTNAQTLQQRAQAALAANGTFLAIGSPTNAQVLAQAQTLTKECSALIRLLLNQFDSTAGT